MIIAPNFKSARMYFKFTHIYSIFVQTMPPKRKAGGGAKGASAAKKAKADAGPATMKDAAAALKAEDKKSTGKKSHKPDSNCSLYNAEVSLCVNMVKVCKIKKKTEPRVSQFIFTYTC